MVFFAGGGDDEDDTEVALVCPAAQRLAEVPDFKPENKAKKKQSTLEAMEEKFVNRTVKCTFSCGVLILVLGVICLSFFYCPACLVGILVISACMTAYESYWNIPLWISMLLIIIFGIKIVNRDVALIWKAT